MTKITITSKPEKKTSSKGTTYYSFKAKGEDGTEKTGNYFADKEPEINQELEVEEKYSDQYKNYSWYEKKDSKGKGGFGGFKPTMSIDQQIRCFALGEAVKLVTSEFAPEEARRVKIKDLAASFEHFILQGKGGAQ